MNLVITGATSFLGWPMTEYCLKKGHRVFAVVRPHSRNSGRIQALLKAFGSRIVPVYMKLEDMDRISDRIEETCQAWIHFGWDGAGSDNRTQQDIQQKNVGDSMCALRGALSLGCSRFLFSGSQAEYGIRNTPMSETDPCCPVSEYGKAKVAFYRQAGEYLAGLAAFSLKEPPVDYVHTRIFSVYGPGDHPWSLVETCRKTFLAGGAMELGDCTGQWNFLHRDDCIRALYKLLEAPGRIGLTGEENGIYNIAAAEEETRPLREYVEEMYRLCGRRGTCLYGKRPPNAEGQINLIPSIEKLQARTGFVPEICFKEGFEALCREEEEKI